MKLVLALLVCIEISLATTEPASLFSNVEQHALYPLPIAKHLSGPRTLRDDFLEMVAILPLDDLLAIFDEHVASDAALSTVIGYLQSEKWKSFVDEVLAKPAAVELVEYLNDNGYSVDISVIDRATPGVKANDSASIRNFLDEIEAALPVDDLLARVQNSPNFLDLYTTMAREKNKALVDDVLQMEEAVYIQDRLTAMGVNVAGVLKAVYNFFGWGTLPRKLSKVNPRDLLGDFLDLITVLPIDYYFEILDYHVANDVSVANVVKYLHSNTWHSFVDEVLAKPTAVEFIDYLNNAGVPVDLIMTIIDRIIEGLVPGDKPSLRPFLDKIEAATPFDDFLDVLYDKLQNSPYYQEWYMIMASEKGKDLFDNVLQMEQSVYIQERLTAMDANVAGVLMAVYDFFGWGDPPK